jgi:hypothetical protein
MAADLATRIAEILASAYVPAQDGHLNPDWNPEVPDGPGNEVRLPQPMAERTAQPPSILVTEGGRQTVRYPTCAQIGDLLAAALSTPGDSEDGVRVTTFTDFAVATVDQTGTVTGIVYRGDRQRECEQVIDRKAHPRFEGEEIALVSATTTRTGVVDKSPWIVLPYTPTSPCDCGLGGHHLPYDHK